MKKFFLFASAALVLASCSSEAEEAVIKPNETPEEEVLELTEIKLGGGAPTASAETRAVNEVTTWSDTKVGIFGVNENASRTTGNNDWSEEPTIGAMNIRAEQAVILLNELAEVANDNKVSFEAGKIYFPRTNNYDYGYTFLGYYPYITTDPTTDPDHISVTGTFDGTQDIMAGKSVSADQLTNGNSIGYNAKYIRDYRKLDYATEYPAIDIKFKHLTSRIDVQLKQGASYIGDMCDVYAAYFEVGEEYTLTFTKDTENNDVTTSLEFGENTVKAYAIGGGDFVQSKSYKQNDIVKQSGQYYKFNEDYTGPWAGAPVTLFTDGFAPEAGPTLNNTYKIFVTPDPQVGPATKMLYLILKNDITIPIPVTVKSPDGGFEAGKAYKVIVTINGPEEITVTASIVEWEEVDGTPGVEI